MEKKSDMKATSDLRPEITKALAAIGRNKKIVAPFDDFSSSFLVNLLADIDWIMKDKGVSQAELARRLGYSEARISKLLGRKRDSANMTAATIARIMGALGEKVDITSPRLQELKKKGWSKLNEHLWAKCVCALPGVHNENQGGRPAPKPVEWSEESLSQWLPKDVSQQAAAA